MLYLIHKTTKNNDRFHIIDLSRHCWCGNSNYASWQETIEEICQEFDKRGCNWYRDKNDPVYTSKTIEEFIKNMGINSDNILAYPLPENFTVKDIANSYPELLL